MDVNVDDLAFYSLDLVQQACESGVFLQRKCLANEESSALGSFDEIEGYCDKAAYVNRRKPDCLIRHDVDMMSVKGVSNLCYPVRLGE